jgi:hypothetical protein
MSARVCLVSDSPRSLPGFTSWPTFPFEGDIRIKKLDEPVAVEPPRHGENPSECRACSSPDEAYIWVSERWRVRSLDRPTGLPMVLILESRSHLDLGDLPNLLAAELGVMTVRLERAVRSLDGVARVHVNRWGDGSAHLHLWFLARPYGRLQLRGTFLSLWDEILPTISESQWRENLALVAAWLAEFGGRPLAEPPRIDWKAPASLSPTVVASPDRERASASSGSDGQRAAGADAPAGERGGTLLRAIEGDLSERAVPVGSAPSTPATTATAPARSMPTQRAAEPRAEDTGRTAPDAEAGERAPDLERSSAKTGSAWADISRAGGVDADAAGAGGVDADAPAAGTKTAASAPATSASTASAAAASAPPSSPSTANPSAASAPGATAGRPDAATGSEPASGAKPAGAVKSVSGAKSDSGKQPGKARSGRIRDRG